MERASRGSRLLLLSAASATMLTPLGVSPARALDECGPAAPGTTIVCNDTGLFFTGAAYVNVPNLTLEHHEESLAKFLFNAVDPANPGNVTITNNGAVARIGTDTLATPGITVINQSATGNATATNNGSITLQNVGAISPGMLGTAVAGEVRLANNGTITLSGPPESHGMIGVTSGGGDIYLDQSGEDSKILTSAGFGMYADATAGGGDVFIGSAEGGLQGLISTGGTGVGATSSSGAIAITSNATILTGGIASHGIHGVVTGNGSLGITQGGEMVETNGDQADGILAWTQGSGALTVGVSGAIVTRGVGAAGIRAVATGGNLEINNSGDITTEATGGAPDDSSWGIAATQLGNGTLTINRTGGAIETAGIAAHGVHALGYGTGAMVLNLTAGSITTTGTTTEAVRAESASTVTINSGSTISASGAAASNGIHVQAPGDILINLTGGSVAGGDDLNSWGVSMNALAGTGTSTLNVSAGVSVGSGGDQAVLGSARRDVVNTFGTINGLVDLGGGDDQFNATGGLVNGSVMLGVGHDTVLWADGADWAGEYLIGGSGNDTATIRNITEADRAGLLQFDGDVGFDTLIFDNTAIVHDNTFVWWEDIDLTNGTALTLRDDLALSEGASSAGRVDIDDTSTLFAGGGIYEIRPLMAGTIDVSNAGAIDLTNGGNTGDRLYILGNYAADGGVIRLDTELGDDSSATDQLAIERQATGSGIIEINNVGGTGGVTDLGILLVTANLSSTMTLALAGDYVLDGEEVVVGGAHVYRLEQEANVMFENWYLRSVDGVYQAGAPLYESYAGVLQSFNRLGTLQQRVGNRTWLGEEGGQGPDGSGIWGRVEGNQASLAPATSTTGAGYDVQTWRAQGGIDAALAVGAGEMVFGLNGQYGQVTADVAALSGSGTIASEGHGIGASATFRGNGGFYVDGQAQYNWYRSTLSSETAALTLADDNAGIGYALSLEAGQKLALGSTFSVTPQAQLAYSQVNFDDFIDAFDAAVSLTDGDSLRGRVGLSVDHQASWEGGEAHLYAIANLFYELLEGSSVSLAGSQLDSAEDRLSAGIGLGGSLNLGAVSLHGEAYANTGLDNFGESYALGATGGLRVSW